MNRAELERVLEEVHAGRLSVAGAADKLRFEPVANLGFASLDQQRHLRCGFPEVVYGAGKTPEQVEAILAKLRESESLCLVTRLSDQQIQHLEKCFDDLKVDRDCRVGWIGDFPQASGGTVAVVTAGTSDLPVAKEAEITARAMGCHTALIVDVGVAGLHRLVARLGELANADAIVVVAGMEGALPSVVGGLVDCPVIAVPTSVGYGANFGGVSALLCMLTSCAANVTVVNIDAGFCAGYVAGLIARRSIPRLSDRAEN